MQAIYSDTSIRPHYVTIAKNGKVCCSDCLSWKARNLCVHYLAAAEKLGMTANGLKQINLGALVTCDSAKGVGKKGHCCTQGRKKCWKNPADSSGRSDQLQSRTSSTECFRFSVNASDVRSSTF